MNYSKNVTWLIEPKFDHALSFCNKKALVCIDQKWGFIEHPLDIENTNGIKYNSDIKIDEIDLIEKQKLN